MKVQELLSSPDKWIQNELARDKYERPVSPISPNAVKWCVEGAIAKCYPAEANEIISNMYFKRIFVATFNDSHTYEEVMNLVRRLNI